VEGRKKIYRDGKKKAKNETKEEEMKVKQNIKKKDDHPLSIIRTRFKDVYERRIYYLGIYGIISKEG
jgi:hypothetical protein